MMVILLYAKKCVDSPTFTIGIVIICFRMNVAYPSPIVLNLYFVILIKQKKS